MGRVPSMGTETGRREQEYVASLLFSSSLFPSCFTHSRLLHLELDADIVWCHGINDYGGKFAIHAPFFLDAGYRLIVPDLPAHGRSTGLHCYIPDMEKLAEAVYQVLVDVLVAEGEANVDAEEGAAATVKPKRKIFVAGQSLGGFTAVLTCLYVVFLPCPHLFPFVHF